jgi:hypothetical protein
VEREAKGCWSVEVVGGAVEAAGVDGAGRRTRDEGRGRKSNGEGEMDEA